MRPLPTQTQPFGHDDRVCRTACFVVREECHPPYDNLPPHRHETPLLTLVLAGRHQETFSGRTLDLGPFELVAKPAGEPHADRIGAEPGRALLVRTTDTPTPEVRDAMGTLGVIRLRSPDVAGAVQRAVAAIRSAEPIRTLALEGALLELLALASRRLRGSGTATPSAAVGRAEEFIVEGLHQRLTIAEIAAAIGVSATGLVRAFRRERGYPIGDYVRRARVAAAIRLLAESDAPLAAIASRCGFCDQSHLGRVLKRQVGLTPAEVRRGRH